MEAVFLKLLHMGASASWLILAVLILRPILRKAPRWVFCLLWALVALRLICPISLESRLSLMPGSNTITDFTAGPIYTGGASVFAPSASYLEGPSRTAIAAIVWIVGANALVLYGWFSSLRIRLSVREAVRLEENAFLCDWVKSPFILGVLKPKIYLPSDLKKNQIPYVLAHERAHLKRRDHWWKPAGFVLLAVYWFNPLIWVAYILLCRDIEMACDEAVVEDMSIEGKKAYSMTLIQCSSPRSPIAACPLAFGEISVKRRVKNVLNFRKPAFWILTVSAVAASLLIVSFLTDPKTVLPDKSFLNYENLAALANQQEDIEATLRGRNTSISGSDLAAFLEQAQWAETEPPTPAPNGDLTIHFYDFLELRFFSDRQDLAQIICGEDSRYYAIPDGQFTQVKDLLLSEIVAKAEALQNGELPTITLKEVLELSRNPENLTLHNLQGYKTESSLYGWIFPINELFSLWVGDPGAGDRFGYAYLQVNGTGGDRLDIQNGDVAEFIENHRDALLDMAVSQQLLEFAEEQHLTGDILAEGHVILASDTLFSNKVTLYIQAVYSMYHVSGNALTDCLSLYEPVILSFSVDEAGTCILTDSWRAKGGNDPELAERFPPDLLDTVRAVNTPSHLMEQAARNAQQTLDALLEEGVDFS